MTDCTRLDRTLFDNNGLNRTVSRRVARVGTHRSENVSLVVCSGINSCVFYIGDAFTYFPLHIEDEQLRLILYDVYGARKL